MKAIIACLLIFLMDGPLAAQYQLNWAISEGDVMVDYDGPIAADQQGNIYVTGMFEGHTTISGHFLPSLHPWTMFDLDAFLAKYDPDGKLLWVRQFAGPGGCYLEDVTTDSQGNVVVAGSVSGESEIGDTTIMGYGDEDMFVAKFDTYGDLIWVRLFGTTQNPDRIRGVAVNKNGDVFIAGQIGQGTVQFDQYQVTNAALTNVLVAGLNGQTGTVKWVKSFGGNSNTEANDVTVSNNYIYVTGNHKEGAVFGSDTFYIHGDSQLVSPSSLFVLQLDLNGHVNWVISPETSSNSLSISRTNDQVCLLARYSRPFQFQGITFGDLPDEYWTNYVVALIDSDGNINWTSEILAYDSTVIYGGDVASANSKVYLTGILQGKALVGQNFIMESDSFQGYAPWEPDKTHVNNAFMVVIDSVGTVESAIVSNKGVPFVAGQLAFHDQDLITTITYSDTLDLGNQQFVSKGWGDILVAKYTDTTVSGGPPDLGEVAFSVYPNPARESLQYEWRSGDSLPGILTLCVYNMLGQVVLNVQTATENGTLNVGQFSAGVYVLSAESSTHGNVGILQFVKQ